jgi:hypothetical protein
MKLLSITILITVTLDAVQGWRALRRVSQEDNGSHRQLQDSFQLVSDDTYERACLIVAGSDAKRDQKLMLGECDLPDQAWKFDNGLFRTTLDENMCMQAGRGGTRPTHGTKMRLFPCDKDKKIQQFDYNWVNIELKDTNMCVIFRGHTADVSKDPIILKSCDESDNQNNWSEDPVD